MYIIEKNIVIVYISYKDICTELVKISTVIYKTHMEIANILSILGRNILLKLCIWVKWMILGGIQKN